MRCLRLSGLLPLLTFAIRDAGRRSRTWLMLAILVIGGYAMLSHYRQLLGEPSEGDPGRFANADIFETRSILPIASARDDIFLRLYAHGPASVRQRCVLLSDASSVRLLRQNTNLLMTEALKQWTTLPILNLTPFLRENRQFYVIEDFSSPGRLIPRLQEIRASIALKEHSPVIPCTASKPPSRSEPPDGKTPDVI